MEKRQDHWIDSTSAEIHPNIGIGEPGVVVVCRGETEQDIEASAEESSTKSWGESPIKVSIVSYLCLVNILWIDCSCSKFADNIILSLYSIN